MRRRVVGCGAVLALMLTSALAGSYQRTRDSNVLVWIEQPQPGQEITWDGRRDRERYATGRGTLTVYAPGKGVETGSNIPSSRRLIVVGRYTGTMQRGKFVNGLNARTPPPASPRSPRFRATPAPRDTSAPVRHPATTPPLNKTPPPRSTPAATPAPSPAATATPENSLNSLTRPPASLGLNSPAETSPRPSPEESPSPSPSP